jgi:hypothetical protein
MALRVGLCVAGVTIVGAIGWLVSMPSGIEIVFNGLAIFGAAYLAAAAAWLGRRRLDSRGAGGHIRGAFPA